MTGDRETTREGTFADSLNLFGAGMNGIGIANRYATFLSALGRYNGYIFDIDGALDEGQLGMAVFQAQEALEAALAAYFVRVGFERLRHKDRWAVWLLLDKHADRDVRNEARELANRNPQDEVEVRKFTSDVQEFAARRLGVESFGLSKEDATAYIVELGHAVSVSKSLMSPSDKGLILDPEASIASMSETEGLESE